ncbi:MAG: 4Fe-4S dicluster domain-containing protein, partial [Kiritimatiellae bacterium]|nr:4Fe-4S dicluster domain-containing protein [Kiritimatiellia bacterium]
KCRPADVAFRWLWDKPEISVVLSGMNNMEQTRQNVESANRSLESWLNKKERAIISEIQKAYRKLSPIPCTKCRYCMPCPSGLDIPVNFELYNNMTIFQGNTLSLCRNLYNTLPESQRAGACKKCKTCEKKCPQQISIVEMLERVHKQFA